MQVPSSANPAKGMCDACAARLNLDKCSRSGFAANMSGTPTASPSGAAVRPCLHASESRPCAHDMW